MQRFPRLFTLVRRLRRARAARPPVAPLAPAVRLALVRLTLASLCAAGGLIGALWRLIVGDLAGAVLIAGCAAMLSSAIGAQLLAGPPR